MKFTYLTYVPRYYPWHISFLQSKYFIHCVNFNCRKANFIASNLPANYLQASSIATATATVIPTIGLFPAPMRPIISTLQIISLFFNEIYPLVKALECIHFYDHCTVKTFSTNTSFLVFMNALYRVLMCSRMGFLISSQNACNLHSALVFVVIF